MNLLDEDIATATVLITGNTVVDATLAVAGRRLPFENPAVAAARASAAGRRLVVVTAHRRESWGAPLDRILAAVRRLVERYADIDVILSSHPNPAVRAQVEAGLGGVERVTVTDPLPYPDLSRLLSEAYLVLTDSGGIQEEAPSFGVPALVLRDVTERVESLHAGCARLVGSDTDLIVKEAAALLDSRVRRDAMTAGGNPYGDGLAAAVRAQATAALLGLAPAPSPLPASPSPVTYGATPDAERRSDAGVTAGGPWRHLRAVLDQRRPRRGTPDHRRRTPRSSGTSTCRSTTRNSCRRCTGSPRSPTPSPSSPPTAPAIAPSLVYDCVAPFGTARIAEFVTVTDGRITGIRQVYDVVALRRYFPGLLDDEET